MHKHETETHPQFVPQTTLRQSGQFKGCMFIADDFDAPLPDEYLDYFYDNFPFKISFT